MVVPAWQPYWAGPAQYYGMPVSVSPPRPRSWAASCGPGLFKGPGTEPGSDSPGRHGPIISGRTEEQAPEEDGPRPAR
eukprot:324403-Hanusia_phi.AAC.2